MPRTRTTAPLTITVSTLLTCLAIPVLADESTEPAPANELHTVKLGTLEKTWDGMLRLETNRSRPVKIGAEQYSRSAEIAEVLVRSGTVRKGDVILRLDTTEIDEAIRDAKIALEERKVQIEIADRTRAIEDESMAISMERTVKSEERAQRDLELFERFRADMMKQRQQMSLEYSQFRVDDADEELRQLQEMYGDTTLADQTKDIVLNRAKRSLNQSQRSFAMAKTEHTLFEKYDFPDRVIDIKDGARWKATDLEHAKIREKLAMMRRELDLAGERRALDKLQERLDDLEADRKRFTVTAPIDGVLTRINLETGDTLGMQQGFAQVHDLSQLALKGKIDAIDLNVLQEGMAVDVEVPAFPGFGFDGTIRSIGLIGSPSGSSTSFPIEVEMKSEDDRLRLGIACNVEATRSFRNVLTVPMEAVQRDGDRTYVLVQRGENTIEQDVVLGLDNGTDVVVLSGLKNGDVVELTGGEDE
ncbi:MAG: efflux RND transporter periplasmic adaptor subunit [Planctomycetota bacterium]|nr:efflux RND transporter periplasmic adaptor subunit [Planctomycetota bacterium]